MSFLTIINRTFQHDLLRYANNEAHTDNSIAFASIVLGKCCSSTTGLLGAQVLIGPCSNDLQNYT